MLHFSGKCKRGSMKAVLKPIPVMLAFIRTALLLSPEYATTSNLFNSLSIIKFSSQRLTILQS